MKHLSRIGWMLAIVAVLCAGVWIGRTLKYKAITGVIENVGMRQIEGAWSLVHVSLKGDDGEQHNFTVSLAEAIRLGLVVQQLGTMSTTGEGRSVKVKCKPGSNEIIAIEDYQAREVAAAESGDTAYLRKTLSRDRSAISKVYTNGRTLLHFACASGESQVVELLIAMGADVRSADKDLFTPLHITPSKEVAELLLAAGADVNASTGSESAEGQETPLYNAARRGDIDLVALLLANGADVHAKTGFSRSTPLHVAANERVADLLISHGADLFARDRNDQTPADTAAKTGRNAVARLLRQLSGSTGGAQEQKNVGAEDGE